MHPEVYSRVMEDEDSPNWVSEETLEAAMREPFVTPLLVSTADVPVAVYALFEKGTGVYEMHAHVLPEHRIEYADSASRMALHWAWNHLNMRRLEAVIPTKFPDVFKHALKMGFVLRDVLDNDFRQGGRTYASYYMVMYSNGNRSSGRNRTGRHGRNLGAQSGTASA